MQQSRSGVLVSIILIVGLATAFALGIHYVGAGLASTALPAPTTTPQPTEVVGPTLGSGSKPHGGTPHRTASPTAVPPTPRPTAVPVPQAKVVMSMNLGPGETAATKTTSFPSGIDKVYCVATFRHIGPSDSVSFRYSNADNGTQIWQSGPGDLLPPIASVERGTSRATFLNGPLNSGKYRCDLLINDKVVDGAPFSVQ